MIHNASNELDAYTPRLMLVTPELAKDLLGRNQANRPTDRALVAQLSAEIKAGNFQLTHQGIALNGSVEDGQLLDGQHRLKAIVMAGIPVKMLVFENIPADTFSVLDTGKRRSGGDVLSLKNERDPTLLASTVRHIHLMKTSPSGSWVGSSSRITNMRLLELFDAQQEEFRIAARVGRQLCQNLGMIPTAGAVGYFLTTEAAPDTPTGEWLGGLASGANLGPTDPRLALIKVMNQLRGGASRRRTDTRSQIGLYIKAWNAWVAKRPVKALRLQRGEITPRPIQLKLSE
ncbi:hypothetical protein JW613_03465 [Streptomyces smyrnaeus]|uniref:ParB/Sulfiredoxin domain-containing protein n=1 Tax=Streptomyces smyrnaeus TaxID=1387713 RepID=A0ABS3XQP3_9ACTN|nr:hypothetical protein [Streptomyces smyrnaeus]MBO8197376.1 hypothetical protein [Streptomyces smyrnaeus]